jgi:PAS domain S-box-containing protein
MIWMGMCWSIALADRINLLKTETESANRGLHASEARYRQLVETMNDGLGIIDGDGRYTYVNDRLAGMLGYAADEMVGKLMMDFADEDDQQILIDQLSKRKIGVTDPYEVTWRRKDGSNLYTVVSPMLLVGDQRKFQGAFAVITDITERVQASRLLEQRVADRTQELSTLLELSHEITTSQSLDYLLNQILERLKTILDYRSSAIILFEEQHWRIIACWPASLEKLEDLLVSPEEMRTLTHAFESRKATYLNNTPHDEAQPVGLGTLVNWLKQGFLADDCSWLGVPLIIKNHPIGLLILGIAGRDGFSDNQLKVAEMFANQAAIVIENNQLLGQLQTSAAAGERNR